MALGPTLRGYHRPWVVKVVLLLVCLDIPSPRGLWEAREVLLGHEKRRTVLRGRADLKGRPFALSLRGTMEDSSYLEGSPVDPPPQLGGGRRFGMVVSQTARQLA